MNSVCAPQIKMTMNNDSYTCFSIKELHEIAKAYNSYIQKKQVCLKEQNKHLGSQVRCALSIPIVLSNDKRKVWNDIYKRLRNICPYESCWVEQKFIKQIEDKKLREKLQSFTFKPKMGSNNNGWLSTIDINNVVRQYQKVDTSFKFLGAQPSDFYKIIRFDWREFITHERIALVLNHDTHKQSGSHWVTLFIDNVNKTIEYFDSVGSPPNRNIKTFIKGLRLVLYNHKYLENNIKHQELDSECGVYSIYYIIQRLKGKSFHQLVNYITKDKVMKTFRKYIFREVHNHLQ